MLRKELIDWESNFRRSVDESTLFEPLYSKLLLTLVKAHGTGTIWNPTPTTDVSMYFVVFFTRLMTPFGTLLSPQMWAYILSFFCSCEKVHSTIWSPTPHHKCKHVFCCFFTTVERLKVPSGPYRHWTAKNSVALSKRVCPTGHRIQVSFKKNVSRGTRDTKISET